MMKDICISCIFYFSINIICCYYFLFAGLMATAAATGTTAAAAVAAANRQQIQLSDLQNILSSMNGGYIQSDGYRDFRTITRKLYKAHLLYFKKI
jgi:hypothetical protein